MEVVTYIVYRALSRLEILYILLERFALKKLPYVTETALGQSHYAFTLTDIFHSGDYIVSSYLKGVM